ncbi:hypothetical protein BN1708_010424 [Verticillium longisporum]|uniref:Uncharacterized protein n=1 Tax=Verticillium longisporum TaxID=100787 RepID=A0A0G4KRK5_VERLO|nr:hypothetical protein BN1708_010424 [Verticillium longisporum]
MSMPGIIVQTSPLPSPSYTLSCTTHRCSTHSTAGYICFAPARKLRFVVAFFPSSAPLLASHMEPVQVVIQTLVLGKASFINLSAAAGR